MKVSVIIPCLNEEGYLDKTLEYVHNLPGNFEIIVVDGGSTDETLKIAERFESVKATVSEKGRANQMNHGAKMATGEILLFLHADTFLPATAYKAITDHLEKHNHIGGSFLLKLDSNHLIFQFYTWCSKLSYEFFTYGDHGIFMKKDVFERIGGYKSIPFMEDVEIQKRLRRAGKFRKLNTAVTTSARRFKRVGTIKQMIMNVLLVGLFKVGVSPIRLKKLYKNHG